MRRYQSEIKSKQELNENYYIMRANDLTELKAKDNVVIKDNKTKTCEQGIIVEKHTNPRSYMVCNKKIRKYNGIEEI